MNSMKQTKLIEEDNSKIEQMEIEIEPELLNIICIVCIL